MPIFICKDIDCPKYGIEVYEAKVSYKEVDNKLIADKARCSECGEIREEVNQNPTFIINIRNSTKRKWSKTTKGTLY